MDEIKLITLYFFICECYNRELRWNCQRFSPNQHQEFTDEELLTVYLYCTSVEKHLSIKSIHHYAERYLRSWFPKLPSYQAFNSRLNRLSGALPCLIAWLLDRCPKTDIWPRHMVLDSMPIMVCSTSRRCRVGSPLVDKGFCSTKNTHYWGLKLHALAWPRSGQLPLPEYLLLSAASEHDLSFIRPFLPRITNRILLGDKIYINQQLNQQLLENQNSQILTPVKPPSRQCLRLKQFDKAADDLFSRAVSSIRQPIESFFNWLIFHTDIQNASKIRSANGLLVHIYGRIAAAITLWAQF